MRRGYTFQVMGKGPTYGVRSPNPQTCSDILSPDSCLLLFKNEGASGDMYENKGRGKAGVRYQGPGVREKSDVRSPTSEGRTTERVR